MIFVCCTKQFFCDTDNDIKIAKIFCGRLLKPWICSWLVLTAIPNHFERQMTLEVCIPPIWWFSCSITHHFFTDPESDVQNAEIFCRRASWTWVCSRLALNSYPKKNQGQMNYEAHIPSPPFWRFSYAIAKNFLAIWISTSKMMKLYVDVHQYLGYANTWTSL